MYVWMYVCMYVCMYVILRTISIISLSAVMSIYRQLKIFLNPQVVYATDRSKAVVLVLFLFCVALWFILRGASCFKVFPCSLSSCFFIPFSIVITLLGEEGTGLCASRAFVCLFLCVSVCHFSLPLRVGGWPRFVIVANRSCHRRPLNNTLSGLIHF